MFLRTLAVLCVLSSAFATVADALEMAVTWGDAHNITSFKDVSTAGTLIYAYNLGDSNVSPADVNGVLFKPWATTTSNKSPHSNIGSVDLNETQATGSGYLVSYNTLGASSGAFNGLSPTYQSMLNSGTSTTADGTMSLTLGGLTAGDTYQIQWWLNNSSLQSGTPTHATATATDSVSLNANVDSTTGALGQYVIGTFIATGASTQITFTSGSSPYTPMINAFQLRDLSIVPEPSTYVFATIATCTLGYLAFRREDHPAQA